MRILIVEDSVKMAALMKRGLEREGYAVDVAGGAQDALWLNRENSFDAIVLDVILDGDPEGLDGMAVCRELRRAGCWTPVLMVTARDAVRDRVEGLDAGADDYLAKPFSFQELLARLRALVRRGAIERPAVLEVGDLVLDPAGHEVFRGDRRIELTPTEFALLEYFMRHSGEALTRRSLLEHVWDFAFEGDQQIVNVYVRSLRDKIDRPFGRASLETVRGVGYRMCDERAQAAAD